MRVVVDLFCGMGGFSEGAKQAGHEVVLAVDCWRPAIEIHKANHPKTRHEIITLGEGEAGSCESVKKLILEVVNGREFHLHGSPPCQELSVANPGGDKVEGMRLVNWFLELVLLIEPDSWSMEQVKPVINYLPSWVKPNILKAVDFGVPQTRERAFIGAGWIAKKTHQNPISVIEALPHIKGELEPVQSMRGRWKSFSVTKNKPLPTITSKTRGQIFIESSGANSKRGNDKEITKPSPTLALPGNQVGPRIFINIDGAGKSKSRRALSGDVSISKPSLTIRNNTPVLRCNFVKLRSLSLEECLVLQSFPSDYDMTGCKLKKDKWTMIGNAVCPLMAKAVMVGLLKPRETLTYWS